MKKFQKIVLVLILGLSLVLVTGCTKKERLYVMNWAQYMSKDVMKAFEKEYNVKIIEDIAES
ncbi:MAG TPA: spermidine/putrescine ABC transporter substrate-binding protein, partial [Bacilli bacterium]|nr:spermidine/putrescine ABC transporter substrate-binding protein [Bacilli bacterium]